jgi:hypothetical protein
MGSTEKYYFLLTQKSIGKDLKNLNADFGFYKKPIYILY